MRLNTTFISLLTYIWRWWKLVSHAKPKEGILQKYTYLINVHVKSKMNFIYASFYAEILTKHKILDKKSYFCDIQTKYSVHQHAFQ